MFVFCSEYVTVRCEWRSREDYSTGKTYIIIRVITFVRPGFRPLIV